MGMPVAQLLQRISSRELAQWRAYEHLYGPVGVEARVDRAAAVIAQQLANAFRGEGKPQPVEAFLPMWGHRPVEGYGEDEGAEDDGGPVA